MGLDEVAAFNGGISTTCSVSTVRVLLDKDDAATLDAALAAPLKEIQHKAIHRWLKSKGHQVSDTTIGTHRKGGCSCGG